MTTVLSTYPITKDCRLEILHIGIDSAKDSYVVHRLSDDPHHRRKKSIVRYTIRGEAYFITNHQRIYLNDCFRAC